MSLGARSTPSAEPEPGNYVAVKVSEKPEAIICQYKKLSYTSSEFELLTLNDHWPNIKVIDGIGVKIVEKVCGVCGSFRPW
jgi:SOS-response transcriptional repressor LexA